MTEQAFAGMTEQAFAGMTEQAFAGMTEQAFAGMTQQAGAGLSYSVGSIIRRSQAQWPGVVSHQVHCLCRSPVWLTLPDFVAEG